MKSLLIAAAAVALLAASAQAETWIASDWALQGVPCSQAEPAAPPPIATEDACLRVVGSPGCVPFWQRGPIRRILSFPWRPPRDVVVVYRRPFWQRGPLRRWLSLPFRRRIGW